MSVTTMDVNVDFSIVIHIVNQNGKPEGSKKLGNQSAVDSRGRAEG